MENSQNNRQPGIIKIVKPQRIGIQPSTLSRHAVGLVLRGKKYIYYGDIRYEINKGDMFYLNIGSHYMEDIPDGNKSFEQIVFFYTPETLCDILSALSLHFQIEINNDHTCENCIDHNHAVYPAWNLVKNFFNSVNLLMKDDLFTEDPAISQLKATELIYMIVSNPDCCINSKLLDNADTISENFERIVQDNIFTGASIESLARMCNKSLTSFKKEFKDHFHETPHRWMIKQRLMRSRLLLISTNKSVADIGVECKFPNTSHFIKLFRKEYELTPAVYRSRSRAEKRQHKEKIKV